MGYAGPTHGSSVPDVVPIVSGRGNPLTSQRPVRLEEALMMRSRSTSAVFPGSLRQRTGRRPTTPPGVMQPIVRSKPDDAESSSPSFDPRPLSEWMREPAFATQDIEDQWHAELATRV